MKNETYTHRKLDQPHSTKSGFTLIELLVVISILAVLALVSFSLSKRMIDKAKDVGCLSNLKSIGAAVFLYSGDNNDNMPNEATAPPENPGGFPSVLWPNALSVYLPWPRNNPAGAGGSAVAPIEPSVFHCPAARKERIWSGTQPDYAANLRPGNGPGVPGVFSRSAWGWLAAPLKRCQIERPERCMMIFDAYNGPTVYYGQWITAIKLGRAEKIVWKS